MPHKKFHVPRLKDLPGPVRKKPCVRQMASERDTLFAEEEVLLSHLSGDALLRSAIGSGMGRAWEPCLVYTDFEHSWALANMGPGDIPTWENCSERMKLQAGYLAAMEFECYTFTAKIPAKLEKAWLSNNEEIAGAIQKRIKRELDRIGMGDIPFAYIIEGRSKRGKSRVPLHLHGYVSPPNRIGSIKFKVALERALLGGDLKRTGRQRAIQVKAARDPQHNARWVTYMSKFATRYDSRLPHGRSYISRSMTQAAREFWALIRDEPISGSVALPMDLQTTG